MRAYYTQVSRFRTIRPGRQTLPAGFNLPRHRHLRPYALVVIAGSFEQTSYAGRVTVEPGDLLVQPTLDCHANRLFSSGAQILRLQWPHVESLGGVYRLRDLDHIVRTAEHDVREASELAQAEVATMQPVAAPIADWPDLFAGQLSHGYSASIEHWARTHGLASETVSRGFTRVYGVGPAQFRHELKVRHAWLRIVGTRDALAGIATGCGFADQPHMTRSVTKITGSTPTAWRRTLSFPLARVLLDAVDSGDRTTPDGNVVP
jgi:AraC-like DNA-binding protein